MILGTIGEEVSHTTILINGFTISIQFGENDTYWSSTRYHADSRHIKLYNDKKELLVELKEKNPHKGEDETRVKEFLKKLGYPKQDNDIRWSNILL